MRPGERPSDIVEQFTFRNGDRAITVDAVIDTGSDTTHITTEVFGTLGLEVRNEVDVRLATDERTVARLCRCTIAWTIYELQGYFSVHDVVWSSGRTVLIGLDVLQRHDLSVDMHYRGLVGYAPQGAEPLTGGGYVQNAPRGFVLKWNYERANAAKPGQTLRPHPAWRFTHPAITRTPSTRPPSEERTPTWPRSS